MLVAGFGTILIKAQRYEPCELYSKRGQAELNFAEAVDKAANYFDGEKWCGELKSQYKDSWAPITNRRSQKWRTQSNDFQPSLSCPTPLQRVSSDYKTFPGGVGCVIKSSDKIPSGHQKYEPDWVAHSSCHGVTPEVVDILELDSKESLHFRYTYIVNLNSEAKSEFNACLDDRRLGLQAKIIAEADFKEDGPPNHKIS